MNISTHQRRILETLLSRTPDFRSWLVDMIGDKKEFDEVWKNRDLVLDYLSDYLRDELSLTVEDDGLILFSSVSKNVDGLLNGLDVGLFHHTSDGIWESIRDRGLIHGDVDTNRHGDTCLGVYLTNETSGPAVDGYLNRAVSIHGGSPMSILIRAAYDELTPDTNDAEIESGSVQYVVLSVPVERIISINGVPVERFSPAPTEPPREHEIRVYRVGKHLYRSADDIDPHGALVEFVDIPVGTTGIQAGGPLSVSAAYKKLFRPYRPDYSPSRGHRSSTKLRQKLAKLSGTKKIHPDGRQIGI